MLKAGAARRRASPFNEPRRSAPDLRQQWLDTLLGSAKIGRPGLPEIVPVTEFRDIFGVALTNMIGGADPATELEEGDRTVQAGLEKSERADAAISQCAGASAPRASASAAATRMRAPTARVKRRYWLFVVAGARGRRRGDRVSVAVHALHVAARVEGRRTRSFVGLANYRTLFTDPRFLRVDLAHALLHRAGGHAADHSRHRRGADVSPQVPVRGLLRGIFILPMMATPVAIALVWTMMFHPQLGVLNYLLSPGRHAARPPGSTVTSTVIPTLVLVETWQWTPLVMLIVLGGLASLPTRAVRGGPDRRRDAVPDASATSRCR